MKANSAIALNDIDYQIAKVFLDTLVQHFDSQLAVVILFGSRARGEANPDSDMDFVVVLDDSTIEKQRIARYLAAEIWLEYGVYISARVWSFEYWQKLGKMQTLLYQNIQRDGVELLALAA